MELLKHEAEIINIRSRNYAQKFKSIDSEVQENIIIASPENHQKKSYLLKTWDEECTLGGQKYHNTLTILASKYFGISQP